LVVLVADDPPLADAIAREWRGRTEQELTVKPVTLQELHSASRLPGDAVIFPSGSVGSLAERGLIAPLENDALEDAEFNYRDIFAQLRLSELRWAGRTFAAPLGSPQLLLCYRADVFQKLDLSPPTDWPSYQQALKRLEELEPEQAALKPAIEPLADGWAGQLLLARAAGYAMHRDQVSPLFKLGTTEPLIDQAPYVRALEELVEAAKTAEFSDLRATPAEAFTTLCEGRCAMALAWPAAGVATGAVRDQHAEIAFAALPISRQAYRFATGSWDTRDRGDSSPIPLLCVAGRAAAVSTSSQDARRASGFVVWLASRDVSERVAAQSSAVTLFRQSQVAKSSRWTPQLNSDESRQYAETLAATLTASKAFPGLNIPGRGEYLTALDQAVYEALSGKPATAALHSAAERWREITAKLGAEAQRQAIGRSLGQRE
jgi:ABC-type glycerol-3-phosphate transport system substrate-binding protein